MRQQKDALTRYLSDIKRYPRISREREIELSRIIRTDCDPERVQEAVHELVHANLLLVVHCLKDFAHWASASIGISEMDLVAEGNIALMDAARSYNALYEGDGNREDYAQPAKFSTYACRCIKRRMTGALRGSRFIHIPEAHFSSWRRMAEIENEFGGCLPDEELAGKMSVSVQKLGMIRQSRRSHTSMLEDLASADDGSPGWSDIVPNEKAVRPDREAAARDERRFLLEEMRELKPRTREMITEMFFSERRPTLRDLSEKHRISQERCRQICAAGLKKLEARIRPRWGKTVGIGFVFGREQQPVPASSLPAILLMELPAAPSRDLLPLQEVA